VRERERERERERVCERVCVNLNVFGPLLALRGARGPRCGSPEGISDITFSSSSSRTGKSVKGLRTHSHLELGVVVAVWSRVVGAVNSIQ